jgi:Protein of unknown function DUF262
MSNPKLKISYFEARTLSWWKARRQKIDMEPPYQRRGRLWSPTDKAYLIDSILNGFDVPKLYVADFTYGDSKLNIKHLPFAIIDGKQRLEAIFDFFDGSITLNRDFSFLENENLLLGGLGYRDLQTNHPEVAEIFDNYNLAVMSVITDREALINELFVRLNRSKPLTGAEIRNAMAGPAPAVIRELAKHEFFKETISFKVLRGQDLNAAAKLLQFEFNNGPAETKKRNLDTFVKSAARQRPVLELAARRTHSMLSALSSIFLPKDRLLASGGILPVYYWFIRGVNENQFQFVREFIVRFEESRKENRTNTTGAPLFNDLDLSEFDQYNRNTNDQSSHTGRVAILEKKFKEFVSTKHAKQKL